MSASATKWEQTILEKLWLIYYNDTLYEKGLISQDMHRRMRMAINVRTQNLLKGEKR